MANPTLPHAKVAILSMPTTAALIRLMLSGIAGLAREGAAPIPSLDMMTPSMDLSEQ